MQIHNELFTANLIWLIPLRCIYVLTSQPGFLLYFSKTPSHFLLFSRSYFTYDKWCPLLCVLFSDAIIHVHFDANASGCFMNKCTFSCCCLAITMWLEMHSFLVLHNCHNLSLRFCLSESRDVASSGFHSIYERHCCSTCLWPECRCQPVCWVGTLWSISGLY